MYILQFKIVPKDKEVLLRHNFRQSFGSIKFTKKCFLTNHIIRSNAANFTEMKFLILFNLSVSIFFKGFEYLFYSKTRVDKSS